MILYLPLLACFQEPSSKIKDDAKAHLGVARNTVLLYSECYKKYKIDRDKEPEKWKRIIKQQGRVCKQYHVKIEELISWCNTIIPAELSHPDAPTDDPEFIQIKEDLEKICTTVLSIPNVHGEKEETEEKEEVEAVPPEPKQDTPKEPAENSK